MEAVLLTVGLILFCLLCDDLLWHAIRLPLYAARLAWWVVSFPLRPLYWLWRSRGKLRRFRVLRWFVRQLCLWLACWGFALAAGHLAIGDPWGTAAMACFGTFFLALGAVTDRLSLKPTDIPRRYEIHARHAAL